MSLYSEYCLEREGKHVLEDDKGFISYLIKGDECYIEDIYVKPAFRKSEHASKLADKACQHAREEGSKYITGSVDPRTNGSTDSLKVLLSYGMKLHSVQGPMIYFIKEL